MQCIKKVVKVSSNWKKLQSKIVDVGKDEDKDEEDAAAAACFEKDIASVKSVRFLFFF